MNNRKLDGNLSPKSVEEAVSNFLPIKFDQAEGHVLKKQACCLKDGELGVCQGCRRHREAACP